LHRLGPRPDQHAFVDHLYQDVVRLRLVVQARYLNGECVRVQQDSGFPTDREISCADAGLTSPALRPAGGARLLASASIRRRKAREPEYGADPSGMLPVPYRRYLAISRTPPGSDRAAFQDRRQGARCETKVTLKSTILK